MSPKRSPPAPSRPVPVGQRRRNREEVQRFRLDFLFAALLLLLAVLLGRLAKLQVVDGAVYRQAAQERHERHYAFRGLRGRIVDVHGRTLAVSRRVLAVAVDPSLVQEPSAFARRLAALLDEAVSASRIESVLRDAPPSCRYRLLVPEVEDDRIVAQLATLRSFRATLRADLKGLIVEERERRTYPNGDYAAHVLGHAPRDPGRGPQGACGMERALDGALSSGRLEVPVRRDGGRRLMAAVPADPARVGGRDARLTLDIVVQHHLEAALDGILRDWEVECAVGIVLDPRTGDVLALANRPVWTGPGGGLALNLAVQGVFPPGSLFKPFTVAQALRVGVVQPEERLEMPSRRVFTWARQGGCSRRTVGDVHAVAEADGRGDLARLIGHSSNVAAGELASRLGVLGMRGLVEALGFDRTTGIQLGGEVTALYEPRDKDRWNPLYPTVGLGYGHGVAVSPLRILCCFGGFARRDARVVRPTLLPGQGGPDLDLPPVSANRVHWNLVRAGLEACVEEGTARAAFAGCPWPVSGKTGTAQIQGTPFQVSSFAGFAPRDRPRLLVLVLAKVDERIAHRESGLRPYGGNVAGPAARSIVERTLAYLGAEGSPEEPR